MSDTGTAARLPPGSMGLPGIGESLAFLRNPYRFLEERRDRHGDVFKSDVAGKKVVFLSGLAGATAFFDSDTIARDNAHPFVMVDLFGGVNFEMYDGPRHFALKSIALEAFDEGALAGYLPDMERTVGDWLDRHADGAPFAAMTALRDLAVQAIGRNLLGLEAGPQTEELTRDYGLLVAGLGAAVPVRIPHTTYGEAMAARDRLLDRLRAMVADRRAQPRGDGLSRMLAGVSPDGGRYTDDEAVVEAHHIVVAGFIVYAHLAEVLRQLAVQPDLLGRCADEIARHAPSGPLTPAALARLATCTTVVFEAKRYVPLVPLAFGRARRDFVCDGYDIPRDWTVYLALHLINRDPAIYRDPERFDPDRFAPGRAEHLSHALAFVPQGAEPPTGHRCLGLDYSTQLTLVLLVLAVRGYDWRLPAQRLDIDWTRRPPEPRDGLVLELRRG